MRARQRLLVVLWLAGGVSVACNVLAAAPTLAGRGVAAWPPIALLLVVEVLARCPLPTGRLRWAATGGAGAVAMVAAVASFHHMHSVALAVGESELVAALFPLSVDGLAVVTSVAILGTHSPTAAPGRPIDTPATPLVAAVDDLELPPLRSTVGQASVSLLVPPLAGGSSPVLNGAGSNQPTTVR